MGTEGTFQIVATPSERWYLAVFLTNEQLKFKGKQATALYRFRCALGLLDATETFLGLSGKGNVQLSFDRKTKNVFTVTPERAEFLNSCIEQLDSGGAQLALFQRVLNQLQEGEPSCGVEGLPVYDESAENWQPTLEPIAEDPLKLGQLILEAVNGSKDEDGKYDYAKFAKRYVEEASPKPSVTRRPAETAKA